MNRRPTGTRCRHRTAVRVALEVRRRDLAREGRGHERRRDRLGKRAVDGSAPVEGHALHTNARPQLPGEREPGDEMCGSSRSRARSLEHAGIADDLSAIRAQPELGEHDRVSVDELPRARIGHERRREPLLEIGHSARDHNLVEQREQLGVAGAGLHARRQVDPRRQLDSHFPACALDSRHGLVPRELEPPDVFERQLPARPGVLERADLHLERSAIGIHAHERDRRTPGIEQPAAIPDHEVPELAGQEVAVGRGIRIGRVGLGHVQPPRINRGSDVTNRGTSVSACSSASSSAAAASASIVAPWPTSSIDGRYGASCDRGGVSRRSG